ncbi:hypothetical protein GCM10023238_17830 [Streptomyces heliomycini]
MTHPHRRRGRRVVLPAALAVAALAGAGLTVLSDAPAEAATARQVEKLDRGVVSVHTGSGNLVSWRWLGTDPDNVAFQRLPGRHQGQLQPRHRLHHLFPLRRALQRRLHRPRGGERRRAGRLGPCRPVPHRLQGRADQSAVRRTTPDGVSYTYEANDASVGDLDGDGALDIVLKWQPTNAKDKLPVRLHSGNTIVDGVKLDGTRLWRVDLGRNIRSGAHYTQFQVYDYDGDGKAEVAMKTADGTKDGTGTVIGSSSADHRNSSGYILSGPEYLTMFNGQTGRAMGTVDYVPARGTVSSWGRLLRQPRRPLPRGTAYLDGARPSLIMARGYYTRTVIAAWDWRDGRFTRRWTFDTNSSPTAARGTTARAPTPSPSATSTTTAGTRSSTARWPSTTTATACGPPGPATATPSTSATSTRRPPAWSTTRSPSPRASPPRCTSTRRTARSAGSSAPAATTAAGSRGTSGRATRARRCGRPRRRHP